MKHLKKMLSSHRGIRKKFFDEESFEEYIRKFPKYCKISLAKYEDYVRDYMIKNRSARIRDVVNGSRDYNIKVDAKDPHSIFYKILVKLIKSGHVIREDNIFIWTYHE